MVELQGLHHTGVFVRDLTVARRFYEEVLGMSCFLQVGRQAFLRFGRGDELALFEDPQRAPQDGPALLRDPHHQAHVAFMVTAAAYAAAKAEFGAGARAYTTIDWGDHECLYFLDPDGNLLELNVAADER